MKISELEKEILKEEDLRIMEKIKNFSEKEKFAYNEGYADAVAYTNKLTIEVYKKYDL